MHMWPNNEILFGLRYSNIKYKNSLIYLYNLKEDLKAVVLH